MRKLNKPQIISLFFAVILPTSDLISCVNSLITLNHSDSFGIKSMLNKDTKSSRHVLTSKKYTSKGLKKDLNSRFDSQVAEMNLTSQVSQSASSGQGDVSGFTVSSSDGMVDKFTGDFNYSIPLLDVEGYPITINYNSNVGMNTEASWVGLGWNLSVGAVNREMRGLPDEFNGSQEIERQYTQREDITTEGKKIGGKVKLSIKDIFSKVDIPHSLDISGTALSGSYKNTYVGYANTLDVGVQSSFSIGEDIRFGVNVGLGYSIDSKGGIGRNSTIGLSGGARSIQSTFDLDFAKSFHSRNGLYERSFQMGLSSFNNGKIISGAQVGTGTYASYGTKTSIPRIRFNEEATSFALSNNISAGSDISSNLQLHAGLLSTNYNSEKKLAQKTINTPALGYLHFGKAQNFTNGKILYDYNKGSDLPLSENMSNLPFSFLTFDFFHASASGISGTYRANRIDVGTVKSMENQTVSKGDNISLGATYTFEDGSSYFLGNAQYGVTSGENSSGNWNGNGTIEFIAESMDSKFDASCYFKAVGENTPNNRSQWNNLGGIIPKKLKLLKDPLSVEISQSNELIDDIPNSQPITINNNSINSNQTKPIVASNFKAYTVNELSSFDNTFISYPLNVFYQMSTNSINRNSSFRKINHISRVDITDEGGTNYEFGIPVYTKLQSEVSFSTNKDLGNLNPNGTISYSGANGSYLGDNSLENNKGLHNYFDKSTVPSYASSFLLTKILSSDYKDMTGDGPSIDDVGSYHRFNYSQVYGNENLTNGMFNSRFPISENPNEAILNRGLISIDNDNTAFYNYEEREVWYLHSIVSKNLVAEFELEVRSDAHGVINENGQRSLEKKSYRLKTIKLYNIHERSEKLGKDAAGAKPLKTIEFVYSYELCKKDPSNINTPANGFPVNYEESGKLTLKEIIVTSGESQENRSHSIKFKYYNGEAVYPYDFSYVNVDSWGNYKWSDPNEPNDLNPYTRQHTVEIGNLCKAWKLVNISNTMGGEIDINYEPDSYSTVQDKRAMRHFKIAKLTNIVDLQRIRSLSSWTFSLQSGLNFTTNFGSNGLFSYLQNNTNMSASSINLFVQKLTGPFSSLMGTKYSRTFGRFVPEHTPNNVIVFKLDTPIPATTSISNADNIVKNTYFSEKESDNQGYQYLKTLYFRMHVNIRSNQNYKELIPMVANISSDMDNIFDNLTSFSDEMKSIGVMPVNPATNTYEYGYVVLDPICVSTKEDSKGADESSSFIGLTMNPLQKSALDFARKNLPSIVYGSCDGCEPDLSIDESASSVFRENLSEFMIANGYLQSFRNDFSTVRLFDPNNLKLASSARVKSITFRDNWKTISDEEGDNQINGEADEEYTWGYEYFESDRLTTSGVAAFEPRSILDENPFYSWNTYIDINKKYPDETNYSVTPIAEPLFPNPIIGYKQVNVNFNNAIAKGRYITKYHTADTKGKTITDETKLVVQDVKNYLGFVGNSHDELGFTQGFVVQTNDFHGKIKEVVLEDKIGNIISKTSYTYFDLDEDVSFVDRDGKITYEKSASEFDVHFESNFVKSQSVIYSLGISGGVKYTPPSAIVPIIFPSGFAAFRESNFFTSTMVKHVNYSARIKSIVTQNFASINTAENILFDKHSGNVILSSLNDEFDDKLFSYNFPSHWYHEQFRNINYQPELKSGSLNNGELTYTGNENFKDNFVIGDVVSVNSTQTAIILDILTTYDPQSNLTTNKVYLINQSGTKFTALNGNVTLELVKSNRKNRLSESMQSIVTKAAPTLSNSINIPASNILSSSAVSYDQKHNVNCVDQSSTPNTFSYDVVVGSVLNPFKYGVIGDYFVNTQYSWQSERNQNMHDHGIRFDGEYSSFFPFYYMTNDYRWNRVIDQTFFTHNWRPSGDVSRFDQFGRPVEGIDPIKVKSSVLYGFNPNLKLFPIAQVSNAEVSQVAFDGFEDYSFATYNPYKQSETHFDFSQTLSPNISFINNSVRHSGNSSLQLNANGVSEVVKKINVSPCSSVSNPISNGQFIANDCICNKPFFPNRDTFLLSVWTRDVLDLNNSNFTNASVQIAFVGSPTVFNATPSGGIIDGWQKIDYFFIIPPNATSIIVRLKNNGGGAVFFDDFRIHPYRSSMSTTVYDQKTLLPIASHDENNFTIFYNYDENLNQVRTRIETINGIKTISETEVGIKK